MRDIKFRGKRVDNGEWIYGYYAIETKNINHKDIHYIFQNNQLGLYRTEVLLETVGQFTGLLDKNGKEIYEGDIVKYKTTKYNIDLNNRNDDYSEITGEDVGIVKYDESKGCFWLNGMISIHVRFEVIGNIYKNPELLEDK